MQLSQEQMNRIFAEEQARAAEEAYRVQVQRALQERNSTGSAPVAAARSDFKKIALSSSVGFVIAVLVVAFVATIGRAKTPAITGFSLTKSAPQTQAPVVLSTGQIAALATPSVVVVENYNEDGQKVGQGSGYVFSADGVVMTNYHVIRGAASLLVKVPGKRELRTDSLLGYDIEHDVAALKIEGDFPALATEDSGQTGTGARVVAIGAPLGLENTVSEGIISAVREINGARIIQTTASISPGSSGGPLLNEYGKVIGLTTAQMGSGQNLNFVISSKHLIELRNDERPMTLEEMLSATRVTEPLPQSTVMVPARQVASLPFAVTGQQGAVLEGSYSITGGGNDVGVILVAAPGTLLVNSGRVASMGQFNRKLPRGNYAIVFDNRFSLLTPKSVSADLKLVYFR
jgi:Trypsin-like peptidase domain